MKYPAALVYSNKFVDILSQSFLTNEEDDAVVTLPLIHCVNLMYSGGESNPKVLDQSWLKGH